MTKLTARDLLQSAPASIRGHVVLTYDERLLRRKRLVTEAGEAFLVDLPSVTNLDDYWGFLLSDGSAVEVRSADEALVEIRGPELLRYAWHIGNRHTPCQIAADRLLIRKDHVLEAMLRGLGAELAAVTEPFTPEGGAYGTGRTMGHSHGPEAGHTHGPGGHRHEEGADAHFEAARPTGLDAPQRRADGSQPQPRLHPHQHGAGCGCGSQSDAHAPAPYQAWSPDAEDLPVGRDFGWHHHGDGVLHYHPPKSAAPSDHHIASGAGATEKRPANAADPLAAAITPLIPRR